MTQKIFHELKASLVRFVPRPSYHHTICCFTVKMKPWLSWIGSRVILKEVEMGNKSAHLWVSSTVVHSIRGEGGCGQKRYMVLIHMDRALCATNQKSLASFLKQ